MEVGRLHQNLSPLWMSEYLSLHSSINNMFAPLPVSDLFANPSYRCYRDRDSWRAHNCSAGPFIDTIRCLVGQAQSRLEEMQAFLGNFERACGVLNHIVMLTEANSSVQPAAKSAAALATKLLQFCLKLQRCRALASELMGDVATSLPSADIPARGLKCTITAQTTVEMLGLFEDACNVIMKYSNGSILGGRLDVRIDEVRYFKDRLRKMKETFGWCLTTEIWKTTRRIEENTDILLLRNLLSPVIEASYNENKLCFEGSRKDTLRAIEEWYQSESSPKLFWLHGSAGLGKTAIAQTVAKLLHDQNRLVSCFAPSDRQRFDRVMPTIAYHLAKWHADYQGYILDVLRGSKWLGISSGLGGQFELLMKQPISGIGIQSPAHKPLVIVLDGLENFYDANDCRRSFLDYIAEIAALAPWLKVFVTSRKCDNIEWHFRQLKVQQFALDDPELDLRNDVVAYARLLADHRDPSQQWSLGMRNDVRGLLNRISMSFGAASKIEGLDPTLRAWDADSDAAKNFRGLIQTVMEREGLFDDKIPVVRDILAVVCTSYFVPIKSPSEELLIHVLRLVQPEVSTDQIQSLIAQLFPIVYTSDENARTRRLRILFPPDEFSRFLSSKEQSGRFYANVESFRRRTLRYYLNMMHTGRASDSSLGSKITLETPTSRAENAARIDSDYDVSCVARWPDGSRIVFGNENGELDIWDGWTGERIGVPTRVHTDRISDVKLSPDGTKLVSGSADKTVKVWDAHERRVVWQQKSNSSVFAVGYSRDGRRVISGHFDGSLRVWDAQNGILIAESQGGRECVCSVAYSPDGGRVVSGSYDRTLRIWDAESGAAVGEPLKAHEDYVRAIEYSPDGDRIVSGSVDWTVRIWDARSNTLVSEPLDHEDWVTDVGYSQDGNTIISASRDGMLRFWDATSGSPIGVLRRGESRLDPVRSHFVSIPEWWPVSRWMCFTIQSLVYSSNPLYIPDDGWVRTLDGNLFLWVPPEHRSCSCHAASESTMTTNLNDERLLARSAWKHLSEERDWTRVIRVEDVKG